MWKEFTEEGYLAYPNFLETVLQILPMYMLRAVGGAMYLVGVFMMVYNLIKTARAGSFVANEEAEAAPLSKTYEKHKNEYWHKWIERRPVQMLVFSLVLVAIGGLIEMVPTFMIESNIPKIASVQPYTPLELQGRDVYLKEGCYTCHSQMIRPFRSETERYGEYSKSGEFIYDYPFQWGSKRTGPDLHRVGGKYPDSWHYNHMLAPRSISPGSIMPAYQWMITNKLDTTTTALEIFASAQLLSYQRKYQESLELLDSLAFEYPNHSLSDEIMWEKVNIFLKQNNIELALQFIDRILESFIYDIYGDDALYTKARIHDYTLNDPENAMKYYLELLTTFPGSLFSVEARKRIRDLRKEG